MDNRIGDSGAKKGKVQSITVTGIHNCCNQCNTTIKGVLDKVDGVKGNTASAKKDSFEVTGDFNDREVFTALQKAGVTGKAGKPTATAE